MDKVERVLAALAGDDVDHAPVSFWGHFFDREGAARDLADSMLEYNRRLDWDYMKVQARASYHAEVWGVEFGASPDGVKSPPCTKPIVNSPEDWERVEPMSPTAPPLDEHLQALKYIKEGLKGEMLFIHTVFSPLTIAAYLVGNDPQKLKRLLIEGGEAAHRALSAIADTFREHMLLCLEAGVSGFFYALSFGPQHDYMTDAEYNEFGRPYDLKVLEGAAEAGFNMLHICRSNINFDLVSDYPVHCYNWETDEPGNPGLGEVLEKAPGAVVGGLGSREPFAESTPQKLVEDTLKALRETSGKRHLLAGGCSQLMKLIPDENFTAIRDTVRNWTPSL